MKRAALFLAVILAVTAVQAQQMQFINDLADKKVVTFGDAVTIFMYTLGREPAGFEADVATLKGMKLLKADRYNKASTLRRGMIALMAARHLKLKGSLFFLMFDTQRYAHRACVAEGLMGVRTSEFDTMTGDELLEIIAVISARMEENK